MESDDVVLVSVRCLVYNHEPYLRQCLEGFVMQKTNFRFEAVVHDDASTDGSAAIICEYAKKYPDIIKPIYETENQYSKHDGSLRKIVNSSCKGKYIALCEGDDYWIDPLKLQKQVDFMEAHPDYMLCGTNGLVLWDGGINAPEYFNRNFTNRELMPEDVIGRWSFPTASLLFKRNLLDLVSEFKCKTYNGDIRLILVALANGRIWSLSDVTTVYRRNNNVNSSTNRIKKRKDHNDFYIGQMLKLYSAYNEYTENRFEKIVSKAINIDMQRLKVIKLRNSIGVLAFLVHPIISYKSIVKIKILNLIKNWVYQHC